MIPSEKLLRYLEDLAKEEHPEINGKEYSQSQVILAERLVRDLQKAIGIASQKPKLSRRRAFIVILEELYYDVPKYPNDLTLDGIHRSASQRFEFSQRSLTRFMTPEDVHPKDPCLFYENNGLKMGNYKVAIAHLLSYSHIYFQIEEAVGSLKKTYTEILLC